MFKAVRLVALVAMAMAAYNIRDTESTKALVYAFLVGAGAASDLIDSAVTYLIRQDPNFVYRLQRNVLWR